MRESQLLSDVIRALYPIVRLMRANVGTVKTADGKHFSTGLPKGFPDLFGVLKPEYSKSGAPLPVFIECKTGYRKPTEEQAAFLETYRGMGCIAGAVWSVDGAWELLMPYINTTEGGAENGGAENVRAEDCEDGEIPQPVEDGETALL